ncbi:RNA polymerase sigma factor [Paenimyroides marinum]|uniref:RNA polymerase sigma factor n=1 Tax=Paenimyroides marinum TaxID=1159016 RepID=UPI001FE0E827|nr:sigma-70 family RNA polymerase sigma factor [Paenimyroides aquimaris]
MRNNILLDEILLGHKVNYTDEELVKLIVDNKDSYYFSILYDRYAKFVYNRCYSFVNSEDEAQDLTHDIFIKIYVSLNTFKGKSKLSTWIYSIVYHFCINYINKKKAQKIVFYEIPDDVNPDKESFDLIDDIDDQDLFEINYEKLQEILQKISDKDRIILLMKYQDDLTIKEISELLGLKESTIKMRLLRAKKRVLELHKQ